jgi:hypothetical protein
MIPTTLMTNPHIVNAVLFILRTSTLPKSKFKRLYLANLLHILEMELSSRSYPLVIPQELNKEYEDLEKRRLGLFISSYDDVGSYSEGDPYG